MPSRRWILCAVNWVKHALRRASGRVWPAHTRNREHRAPTRNPCERAWESDANGSNWPGPPCRAGCLAAAASELTRTWHRPSHPLHLPWRCEIGAEPMRRLRRTPATGGDLTRLANGCAGGSIRGGTSRSRSPCVRTTRPPVRTNSLARQWIKTEAGGDWPLSFSSRSDQRCLVAGPPPTITQRFTQHFRCDRA